jgi:hypothetical protein
MCREYIITESQLEVAIAALEKLQEDYPVDMSQENDPDVLYNIQVLDELRKLESI